MELTHRYDKETGHLVQIVSPQRLRELLDEHGENYERPKDFKPEDEWDVGSVATTH